MANYMIAQLDEIEPVECPCGLSRRAFGDAADGAATMHVVEISRDARVHYHRKLTEIYVVLDGTGFVELDGEKVAARPMTAILIKPDCRHRAVGKMRIIVACIPAFDPQDEWFD